MQTLRPELGWEGFGLIDSLRCCCNCGCSNFFVNHIGSREKDPSLPHFIPSAVLVFLFNPGHFIKLLAVSFFSTRVTVSDSLLLFQQNMESSCTAKERNSQTLRRSVWRLRLKRIVLLAPTKGFPQCPSTSESILLMVSLNAVSEVRG